MMLSCLLVVGPHLLTHPLVVKGYLWEICWLKGLFGLCPQAALPKLASQFFGAGFGFPWVAKSSARISEEDIKWSVDSQIIGNKPNRQKYIWHDQFFGRVSWGHKQNMPEVSYAFPCPGDVLGGRMGPPRLLRLVCLSVPFALEVLL
jgi:hypothetical protein